MTHTLRTGITLASLLLSSAALATPVAGDLAFVALNADEDGFALTTFVDLSAGEQVQFTDNEWNGAPLGAGGTFTSGEGVLSWTLDADITAGSVVRFGSVNSSSALWASSGVLSRSGSFSLATTNDSVVAYLDMAGALTPLAAIGYGADFDSQMAGAGVDAATVSLSGRVDYAEYTGARSGLADLHDFGLLINDPASWLVRESTVETNTLPNLAAFAVTAPVPEPETYAMMLAGLGLLGGVARKRARR